MLQVPFSGEQKHEEQKAGRNIMSWGKASSKKQIPPPRWRPKEGDSGTETLPGAVQGGVPRWVMDRRGSLSQQFYSLALLRFLWRYLGSHFDILVSGFPLLGLKIKSR